jgi:hypothetical protein
VTHIRHDVLTARAMGEVVGQRWRAVFLIEPGAPHTDIWAEF